MVRRFNAVTVEALVLLIVLLITALLAVICVVRDLYLSGMFRIFQFVFTFDLIEIYYHFGGGPVLNVLAKFAVNAIPEVIALVQEVVAPVVESILLFLFCNFLKFSFFCVQKWKTTQVTNTNQDGERLYQLILLYLEIGRAHV